MNDRDLKKMSRRELVEIIYQMKKNEQRMQEQIDTLQAALEDKRIRISQAGSIADAAAALTNLFAAAQATADLYLGEIACMKAETERECKKMVAEADRTSAEVLSDGSKPCSV